MLRQPNLTIQRDGATLLGYLNAVTGIHTLLTNLSAESEAGNHESDRFACNAMQLADPAFEPAVYYIRSRFEELNGRRV